jgi:bacteriocin-like protein
MKELSFKKMEEIQGGSMLGCIGGSAFSVGLFVAGAVLATTVTAGAAAVMIVGLYGGIGFSCLT